MIHFKRTVLIPNSEIVQSRLNTQLLRLILILTKGKSPLLHLLLTRMIINYMPGGIIGKFISLNLDFNFNVASEAAVGWVED